MKSHEINIGDIVKYLKSTPETTARITNLIQTDAFIQKVLKDHGLYPSNLQKKLKLSGYQNENLKKEVLKRLPMLLTREDEYMWQFYKTAYIIYLKEKMPHLDDLLKKIQVIKKTYTSQELFFKIRSHSAEFKVTNEQLYNFYTYWPFEKNENEDKLFEQIVFKVEKEVKVSNGADIKDKVLDEGRLEKELEQIRKSIEKINNQKNNEFEKSCNAKLISLEEKIDEMNSIIGIVGDVQAKVKKLQEKDATFENELPRIKKDIQELSRDLHNEFNKKIEDVKNEMEQFSKNHYEQILSVVNGRIDDIAKTLHVKNQKINESELKLNFTDERKRIPIKQEEIFLGSWFEHLSESGINISNDAALVSHTFFKSCNYLIVDDYSVLESWLNFSGLCDSTNIESVAPLWTDRLDWYGTSKFLEGAGEQAKFAVFRNFNLGMTNSYIYPTLDKWTTAKINKRHKVFLIPSIGNEDSVTFNEVLGIAPWLKDLEVKVSSKTQWKHHNLNLHKNLPLINQATLTSWIKESNETDYRIELLITPSRSLNIKIPEVLLHNFNSIFANLRKYFNEEESNLIAIECAFKPYLIAMYGEETFITYRDLVKAFR